MKNSSKRNPARSKRIVLDGETLKLEQIEAVANGASCALAPGVGLLVRRSRETVERAVGSGRRIYGVNTGFGQLAQVQVPDEQLNQLQRNLIRSHSAGVGPPLPEPVVRAALALRANCLARGHSGLRLKTLQCIIQMINSGIHPVVPEKGSVCASGDLAPLAHLALAMIGEGQVFHRGKRVSARTALKRAKIEPVQLEAKEGLALINGTQVTTAIGSLALLSAERLAVAADIVGAMTLEALMGSHRAFAKQIHQARPQRGQVISAANLRRLLRSSEIERSHADCGRVQDSYSLRCMPQVHGAVRDTLRHVREVLEIEANSSTDNPMVFVEGDKLVSAGNFHGQPVSLVMDHLATAMCSLGTISERRIDRLLNPDLSGLPPFLAHEPGLNSGFMLAHVTAAALVSENKVLAHPASVDTIPTSAGKEDHVAMGTHAARKARQIIDHIGTVLAIEMLCAAQALDLRRPLTAGSGVEAVRRAVRRRIPHLLEDRVMSGEIERAKALLEQQVVRVAAEKAAGRLA